jgi:hypothetical protein
VKRIFHWNGEDHKFDVVKVNMAERNQYETHADVRLSSGMVSDHSIRSLLDLGLSDASWALCQGG